MTIDHIVKETATVPIDATITDEDGVVDLSGASVGITITPQDSDTPVVDDTATVADAASGEVEWSLTTEVTDTPGQYDVEWTVDAGDGSFKYPQERYEVLHVAPALSTATLDGGGSDSSSTTLDTAFDAGFA